MSLETGSSGDFRKVTFNCTCSGHALGAKSAKNQVELNFSSSFTMPVPHAALLHFRRIPRRGPGCLSFRAARRAGGGSGICGSRTMAGPAGVLTRRGEGKTKPPGAPFFWGGPRRKEQRAPSRGGSKTSRGEKEKKKC